MNGDPVIVHRYDVDLHVDLHLIDVNVSLSRWPFRRLQFDEAPALVTKLRSLGIVQAWAGSFERVLHRDIEGVNLRLAAECQQTNGFLLPFGAINPMLPDWEEDIRRCHENHKMPGVRLYPNYHGYTLDSPLFERLLDLCAARGLTVQIAASMEDERTQHPLVRVPPVDVVALPQVMAKVPAARVILLNALRDSPRRRAAHAAGQVRASFPRHRIAQKASAELETWSPVSPPEPSLFGSRARTSILNRRY